MKTIRIRKFTILCLFIILIFPWIFYVGAHFLETKSFNLGIQANSKTTQITAVITGLLLAFLIVAYAMTFIFNKSIAFTSIFILRINTADFLYD